MKYFAHSVLSTGGELFLCVFTIKPIQSSPQLEECLYK